MNYLFLFYNNLITNNKIILSSNKENKKYKITKVKAKSF